MARSELFRKVQHWLRLAQEENSEAGALERDEARHWQRLSRRKMLQDGAQLLAWSSLPACVTRAFDGSGAAALGNASHIVVGGGLAGLTAAYELAKSGVTVQVFEASDRLGGRVQTQYGFNGENMFCEGGGEFIDTGHEAIIALAAELGVPTQALNGGEQQLKPEIYYFGGRLRSSKELIRAFTPLAKILLRDQVKLQTAGEVQVPTYNQAASDGVKQLDRTSLESYLDRCRKHVDAWIIELIKSAYIGEYGLEPSEQSALNLLVLIEPKTKDGFKIFGDSDEAWRIEGGNSRLVEALSKKLTALKVPVYMQHRLLGVRPQGEGLRLSFATAGKTVEFDSRQTILALPLPLLRRLDGLLDLDMSPVKKRMIRELGFGTNSKLMLGFRDRSWRFGPRGHEGSIFTDLGSQAFWETSRRQLGNAGILTNFLGGKAGALIGPGKIAQVLDDLNRIQPGLAEQHDQKRFLQHWPSQALALGSYICPKPGQYTELIGSAEESELRGHLHFVGEHCSTEYGGYMNGAVASAKALVQRLLTPVAAEIKAS